MVVGLTVEINHESDNFYITFLTLPSESILISSALFSNLILTNSLQIIDHSHHNNYDRRPITKSVNYCIERIAIDNNVWSMI